MQMLRGGGGSNNKVDAEVRKSQEARRASAKNSSGSGKLSNAFYSAVEMSKQPSYSQVAPQSKP